MSGFDLDMPLQIALQLAALLAAVILHENAHGRVAWRLGDPTARQMGRLTFNPLAHIDPIGSLILPLGMALVGLLPFGWARPVPINPTYFKKPYWGMMLVALAGPLTNLTLTGLSALALYLLGSGYPQLVELITSYLTSPTAHLFTAGTALGEQFLLGTFYFLLVFGLINLILAIFNLMPIPPLDGSRVLTYFLPPAAQRFMIRIEGFALVIAIVVVFALQQSHLLARVFTPVIDWWFHLILSV